MYTLLGRRIERLFRIFFLVSWRSDDDCDDEYVLISFYITADSKITKLFYSVFTCNGTLGWLREDVTIMNKPKDRGNTSAYYSLRGQNICYLINFRHCKSICNAVKLPANAFSPNLFVRDAVRGFMTFVEYFCTLYLTHCYMSHLISALRRTSEGKMNARRIRRKKYILEGK